ncbi:MAG: class I SAM-dependent methyltransferase [Oligoflexia bacterium]|nr:class I SAM-dependent methyltransferase [Oligoflexia bacterium]
MKKYFPNLLFEILTNELPSRLQTYRLRGFLTDEHVAADPFLQQIKYQRGWSLQELNSWFTYHSSSDDGCIPSIGWALEDVPQDMVFGPPVVTFKKLLQQHLTTPTFRAADFGAGTAMRSIQLAAMFPKGMFTAFEPAPDMFLIANTNQQQKSTPNHSLHQLTADKASKTEGLDGSFDFAFSICCAHFSNSIRKHFIGIRQCLKPGGILILREFMLDSSLSVLQQRFLAEFCCRGVSMRHPPMVESEYCKLLKECSLTFLSSFDVSGVTGRDYEAFRRELALELQISDNDSLAALAIKKITLFQAT